MFDQNAHKALHRAQQGTMKHHGLVGLAIRRRNKGFYVYPGRKLMYSVSDVLDVEQGALKPHDVKVLPTGEGPVLVDGEGQRLSLYMPLDDFNT